MVSWIFHNSILSNAGKLLMALIKSSGFTLQKSTFSTVYLNSDILALENLPIIRVQLCFSSRNRFSWRKDGSNIWIFPNAPGLWLQLKFNLIPNVKEKKNLVLVFLLLHLWFGCNSMTSWLSRSFVLVISFHLDLNCYCSSAVPSAL